MATGTAITNYEENRLLDLSVTSGSTYLALLTAITDSETPTVTEVTGGSYARKAITWAAASGGAKANSALIDFGTATADWGTIVGLGIYDAASAGNAKWIGNLVTSRAVLNGDPVQVAIGKLTVNLD